MTDFSNVEIGLFYIFFAPVFCDLLHAGVWGKSCCSLADNHIESRFCDPSCVHVQVSL